MAGMSSEMQRHMEEPTAGQVKKNQKEEKIERRFTFYDPLVGFDFFGTMSEFVKLRNQKEKERMMKLDDPSGIYQIGGSRYSGITPQLATNLQQLEKASPVLFTGNDGKWHRIKIKLPAEAGGPEESVKEAGKPGEAEGKQRDLIDSQEKLAKKKAKDEEAGKASVREAGKSEASVREAGQAAEAVADINSAGGDSVISEEAENELGKMAGLRSKMQQDAEEPLQMEAKAKKNGKKNRKKNRKKAKAQANLKEEEVGKAEESVTQTGKPEESVTQSGKAEASVTEAGKPEESVTQSGKAEASVTDEETDEEVSPVFEDAEVFGARFQSFWEKCWGHRCAYHETTTIPAMCYTSGSDGYVCTMDTLQVVSIKVTSIQEGLHWPLHVFGMVSIRDVVDRKRNIIFHRERDNWQTITKKDPYLTLTGPSRAVVVCHDPSYIEVVLKVKGATESEDKELSRLGVVYRHSCLINGLYPSELSTIKLRFSQVYGSVEATVHIKVTGGSWPDGFKGVFGAFTARTECAKVKLLSVGDDGLPVDAADGGMIRLSRRVVSVELHGMLKVFISACPAAGGDEECCEASFVPHEAGVSTGVELKIGSCRMEATVAWSLFCGMY